MTTRIRKLFMTIINKITGHAMSEQVHQLKNQLTNEMLNVQKEQRIQNRKIEVQNTRLDQTADIVYRSTQGAKHVFHS